MKLARNLKNEFLMRSWLKLKIKRDCIVIVVIFGVKQKCI